MRLTFTTLVLASTLCLAQTTPNIRLNQVGFYTHGPKMAAIINSNATAFSIRTLTGDSVFGGQLSAAQDWSLSGESVRIADFSDFKSEGKFYVSVNGLGNSYTFQIQEKVFAPLNKALMKAFYFNRISTALDAKYAGKWARPAGHPDLNVIVHPSAASAARPAGTVIRSPKGWYDAGDYNAYIVNSGISTYTLLISYEHFKGYYDTLNLNIPESGNNTPDILDEIKWNLDWMLTMQDPNDGGVYFKKTNANFDGSVMPHAATSPRYVVTKSTSSAHNFAAVMAVAYRIYKPFMSSFADSCLEAAKKAHAWGVANPAITFTNPGAQSGYPAITTGQYGDGNLSDELEWASNELYIATKEDSYYTTSGYRGTNTYNLPSWPNVRTLGLLSLLHHRKNLTQAAFGDTISMKNKLFTLVNPYVNYQKNTSPYRIVMGQGGNGNFTWGSNSVVTNQAMLLLNAYQLTGNLDYAAAAVSQIDYLMGRNATTYSFVTGMGSKPAMNIHHRQSEADNLADPVPGWVAGGPTGSTGDGCANNTIQLAISYSDEQRCYTKNEVAINWNAPAVYATGALEAMGIFNQELPTSLEKESGITAKHSLSTYPVPSKDEVTLVLNALSSTNATVHISDAMGREYMKKSWMVTKGENHLSLDIRTFTPGMYMVNVDMQGSILKGKIVVTKE